MAEAKTQPTTADVRAYLEQITDAQKQRDCFALLDLMQEITGAPPVLWGENIVGFDRYHYQYASGRSGDWPLTAFSPRKANLTVYIMSGIDNHAGLISRLGKCSTARACLYIKRLADVDSAVLKELIRASVEQMRRDYPA